MALALVVDASSIGAVRLGAALEAWLEDRSQFQLELSGVGDNRW